ncbi:MAG: peroxidase [Armatimonadota bacterium]
MSELDLADIQGFILRGYTMPFLRCLVLRVEEPKGARAFLNTVRPEVMTAAPWSIKPASCLNLGITFDGLRALGLSEDSLQSFPEEFRDGALGRAAHIGDTGANAPENWTDPYATTDTHLVLWLFAQTREALEERSAWLRSRFAADGSVRELSCHDSEALPQGLVHFGYRDSISQPNIVGGPWAGLDDPLPRAPAGSFLLGYPSQLRDFSYAVPTPDALGFNGSFAAFRILEQDVHGFETFLHETAPKIEMSVELLAAKICGRWRNGVPLALSPETDKPEPPIPFEKLNYFDYVPTESSPDAFDDRRGLRCPIGSHLRRANPRSSRIRGSGGHIHRVVRRGMPYGPPYDPQNPHDGIERGLLGVFIGVSLKDQFEFLMREWVNDGAFAPGLGSSRDPLAGDNDPAESRFVIPTEDGNRVISGFSRFVTTRGSAYCFLPSLTALRWLGQNSDSP